MTKSSGGAKSKEQRDVDRRKRQIEKLPSPVALHDVQYPMDKTVLCDQHLQHSLFCDDLDTPHLFGSSPPDDFFVSWNIKEAGRTQYPEVPAADYRLETTDTAAWDTHRVIAQRLLRKHEVIPQMLSNCAMKANVAVVFDDSAHLGRENFWLTSHYGNFIELSALQKAPCVHIRESGSQKKFCLVIASPDYPHRGASNSNYFLHHVAVNLEAAQVSRGEQVLEYIPPLPSEGAGACRVLCLLYAQRETIPSGIREVSFAERSTFRLHGHSARGFELQLSSWLERDPVTVSFFTTSWDIQVQEWYERQKLAEPNYVPEDLVDMLSVNSKRREDFQISSRTLPDGSTNNQGEVKIDPVGKTQHDRKRLNHLLSARTRLSRDGRYYVTPE